MILCLPRQKSTCHFLAALVHYTFEQEWLRLCDGGVMSITYSVTAQKVLMQSNNHFEGVPFCESSSVGTDLKINKSLWV